MNAGELAHIDTLHVPARRGINFLKAYDLDRFCRRPQNHKCSKTLLACIWIYRLSVLRVNSWPVTQICSDSKSKIICNSSQLPVQSG